MTTVYSVIAQDSTTKGAEDGTHAFRLMRDGSLASIPWIQALCLEGRVYGAQFGDATTDPVGAGTFGAGAADLDEFDFLQTIPATVAVLPLYYGMEFLAIGTVAEVGLHVIWGSGGVKHASGITPVAFNMRPGSNNASVCTLSALSDDGGTAMTPAGVIYQAVTTGITSAANSVAPYVPAWSAATAGFVPVLEGAAGTGRQIAAFANAQAGTGYFRTYYAELPVSQIA